MAGKMKKMMKATVATMQQLIEIFLRISIYMVDTATMSLNEKKSIVQHVFAKYGAVSTTVGHILNSTKCPKSMRLRGECHDTDRTAAAVYLEELVERIRSRTE